MRKSVTLKGKNEGFYLYLDDQSNIDKMFQEAKELFKKIKKDEQYKESFELVIDTGSRVLTEIKKEQLANMIAQHTNFDIKKFKEHVIDIELANKWYADTSPMLVVKNIRNGQVVQSERDIILLGDVRPGGLVRSAGNIIIIGEVHGTVHAGSKGNEEVIIVAPFDYNSQVRIGEHIEIIEVTDSEKPSKNNIEMKTGHQIVYINDLHVIEFEDINKLEKIRPDFAKDLGGFEEWQKQL